MGPARDRDRHEQEPTLVFALYQEGMGRLDHGNPGAAAEVLELAAEQEPGKASLQEALGRAYFASSRVGLARDAFQRALELNPTDDYAHYGVGRCFERQSRLSEAEKHFKLACALADRSDYRTALERVQRRLG